jgi:hypothetical protein
MSFGERDAASPVSTGGAMAKDKLAFTSSAVSDSPEKSIQNRLIVYTARIQVESKKIDLSKKQIISIAEQFDGYMQSSRQNTLELRIPALNLKKFLATVKSKFKKYNEELTADDVSEQYYDIQVRLKNAEKLRERFLTLLKQAKTVEDTLKVETELGRITEKIELWTGKLKLLKSRISMSRVTVHIYKEYEPPPPEKTYTPGPLGWPFYVMYKGLIYLGKGIYWLFVWEEDNVVKD